MENKITKSLVIIGGGPAGLAAAVAAAENGLPAEDILILERDGRLGGILNQCIHNGFGLHTFREELTGPEYAARFVTKVRELGIEYKLNTMVLDLAADKAVTAMNKTDGLFQLHPKAVILAMGCRERPRGALNIPGYRPAGIFTAGTAQRLVNMEGCLPGRRVVILGSGDIGLIMARRMTLEGAKVLCVAELMPYSGGLKRNIVQCLDDFGIPLKLSHTVVDIQGKERVTGITLARVENGKPIPGTEEQLPIDVVVDGELYAQYFEPESLGGVICLPSFTAGQHVTMVLGIADDEIFHTNTQIYQLDSAALAAARQQVQDVDADIREGGRIDVHCTVSGDNDLLALSFAYDDNWVVTVNGEEVQPSALFGGLLGVSLPQGDCTVTLRYTHPGVVPGAAASLAALAAALVWWFAERRRSQNA